MAIGREEKSYGNHSSSDDLDHFTWRSDLFLYLGRPHIPWMDLFRRLTVPRTSLISSKRTGPEEKDREKGRMEQCEGQMGAKKQSKSDQNRVSDH